MSLAKSGVPAERPICPSGAGATWLRGSPATGTEGGAWAGMAGEWTSRPAQVKFLRKLLKGLTYVPRVVIMDKLASYGTAMRAVLPGVEHRRHKGLNNRAENSHQPTRERERRMRRFKSPGHAQRFLASYGLLNSYFRPRRHRLTAADYRRQRDRSFATWREVTGVSAAA